MYACVCETYDQSRVTDKASVVAVVRQVDGDGVGTTEVLQQVVRTQPRVRVRAAVCVEATSELAKRIIIYLKNCECTNYVSFLLCEPDLQSVKGHELLTCPRHADSCIRHNPICGHKRCSKIHLSNLTLNKTVPVKSSRFSQDLQKCNNFRTALARPYRRCRR